MKRKLLSPPVLQELLQISYTYFYLIFHVDLSFLCNISTCAKKAMFWTLLTRQIYHILESCNNKYIYIYIIGCRRILLKEQFFVFVILKAFFGPQKSERTRRKYCRSIMTYFAILCYAHFVPILTLFQPEKPQCGKKPCLRWRGYFHSVFVCTSLWLEKHICLYSWKQTWTVSPFNIIFYQKDVCITYLLCK